MLGYMLGYLYLYFTIIPCSSPSPQALYHKLSLYYQPELRCAMQTLQVS